MHIHMASSDYRVPSSQGLLDGGKPEQYMYQHMGHSNLHQTAVRLAYRYSRSDQYILRWFRPESRLSQLSGVYVPYICGPMYIDMS